MLHRCCLFRKLNLLFFTSFLLVICKFSETLSPYVAVSPALTSISFKAFFFFFLTIKETSMVFVMGYANQFVCRHSSYLFILLMSGPLEKKTLPRVEGHYRRCSRTGVEHCSCTSTTRVGTE